MSDNPTERFNALLYPTTLCVIVSCFPYVSLNLAPISLEVERWIMYVLTGGITLAHIHYGAGVVSAYLYSSSIHQLNHLSPPRFVKCVTTLRYAALR